MKESRKISTRKDSGNRGTKDERERAWRELREGDARGEKLELRELNGERCETSSRTEARSRYCEKKRNKREKERIESERETEIRGAVTKEEGGFELEELSFWRFCGETTI